MDYETQQKIRDTNNELQALKVRIKNQETRIFRLEEKVRKLGG